MFVPFVVVIFIPTICVIMYYFGWFEGFKKCDVIMLSSINRYTQDNNYLSEELANANDKINQLKNLLEFEKSDKASLKEYYEANKNGFAERIKQLTDDYNQELDRAANAEHELECLKKIMEDDKTVYRAKLNEMAAAHENALVTTYNTTKTKFQQEKTEYGNERFIAGREQVMQRVMSSLEDLDKSTFNEIVSDMKA
jgi:cysteinyl-tRNA synthetase